MFFSVEQEIKEEAHRDNFRSKGQERGSPRVEGWEGLFTPGTKGVAAVGANSPHTGLRDSVAFCKEGSKAVGEALQFLAGEFLTQHTFNGFDMGKFLRHEQGKGVSLLGGAAGAADTMNVIFRVLRDVVVNDVGDSSNIEAAGGDIGSNEDGIFARAKAGEGFGTFRLRAVGVKDPDGVR